MFAWGEWDLKREPIIPGVVDPSPGFRTMYEMFVDNKTVEETAEYREMNNQLRTRGQTENHKHSTMEQAVESLNGYKVIFNDIKKNGYKSQRELGNPHWNDDIWVCVDRNGEFMYYGRGSHRLAIVKILGIEFIPVGVRHVHPLWATHCVERYGGGVLEAVEKWLAEIDCGQLVDQRHEPTAA